MLVWKYIVASVVSVTFFSQQVLWAGDTFVPVQEPNTTRPIQIYRPVSSVLSVSNVAPIAQTYPAPESQIITTTEFLQNDAPLSASDDPSLDSDTNPNVESTGLPGIDTGNLKDLILPDLEPIPNPIDPELRDLNHEVTGYQPIDSSLLNQSQNESSEPETTQLSESESQPLSSDPVVIQINDIIVKDAANWISFGTGFTISNHDPDVSGFSVINNQDTTYTPPSGSPEEISGQGVGFYIASGGLRFGDSVHIQTYINNNRPAGTYQGSRRVQASRTSDNAYFDVATVYYTIEVRDSVSPNEGTFPEGTVHTLQPIVVLNVPSLPIPDSSSNDNQDLEPVRIEVPVQEQPMRVMPVELVHQSDPSSGRAVLQATVVAVPAVGNSSFQGSAGGSSSTVFGQPQNSSSESSGTSGFPDAFAATVTATVMLQENESTAKENVSTDQEAVQFDDNITLIPTPQLKERKNESEGRAVISASIMEISSGAFASSSSQVAESQKDKAKAQPSAAEQFVPLVPVEIHTEGAEHRYEAINVRISQMFDSYRRNASAPIKSIQKVEPVKRPNIILKPFLSNQTVRK